MPHSPIFVCPARRDRRDLSLCSPGNLHDGTVPLRAVPRTINGSKTVDEDDRWHDGTLGTVQPLTFTNRGWHGPLRDEEKGTTEMMNMVRRMRLVALLGLMLLGLVATTAAPVGATSIYVDPQARFAIGVADGWARQQPDTRGVLALWTVDDGSAIFNVVREDIPDGTTNVEYAKANIDGVSSLNGYKEIRRDFIKCADQDCPLLDYTVIDENGKTQRIQQAFVTKGSDGWVLTYRTFASSDKDYKSDVELMIYSFSI